MVRFGACNTCGCVVRVDHFTAHRTFHADTKTRDPGTHGFVDILEFPGHPR